MFRYCLSDARKCLSLWWFVLSGVIYIVSSCKYLTSARSVSDYIILCFSNPYYFLLILPPLLFLFLLQLKWIPSAHILSRSFFYSKYLTARLFSVLSSLVFIIIFHLCLTVIVWFVFLLYPSEVALDANSDFLVLLYTDYFGSAGASIGVMLLNYLLGIYCLSLMVGAIVLRFPKKWSIATTILLYCILLIGVQRSAEWNAVPLFLGNYIMLSIAVTNNLFPWSIGVLLSLCILVIESMYRKWWRSAAW